MSVKLPAMFDQIISPYTFDKIVEIQRTFSPKVKIIAEIARKGLWEQKTGAGVPLVTGVTPTAFKQYVDPHPTGERRHDNLDLRTRRIDPKLNSCLS